jgi:hypothetical protein
MLRFLSSFASSIRSVYLSFVDLVAVPRMCEVASRAAPRPAESAKFEFVNAMPKRAKEVQ